MEFFKWNRVYIKIIPILALLATLLGVAAGCGDFGQYPAPAPTTEPPQLVASPSTVISSDRAVLAVYEHLLSQAESYKAKLYLAEFYAVCDNWSATTERFKDGSSIWYVLVDMTGSESWKWRPYWQQASWFVLQDGKVIPTNRLQANALMIEADLQELSLQPKS